MSNIRSVLTGIFLWLAATAALAGFAGGGQLVGFWGYTAGGCGASGATFQQGTLVVDVATPATLSGAALGAPCDTRVITVAIHLEDDDDENLIDVTSVTIGGVSAAERAEIRNGAGALDPLVSIWTAVVPTGTTGDVTFAWSGDIDDNPAVGVWRVISVDDADGVPTDTDTDINAGPLDSVTIPAGGSAVFACTGGLDTNDSGGSAMTNAGTERYELDGGTDGEYVGYDGATAGSTPSVVCTQGGGGAEAYAGVSFGP